MSRNGKIARLPHEVREELNRRMRDGEEGKQVVKWLNTLPAVQEVVQAKFGGEPVLEQNLSQWRKGGYREWLRQQEALAGVGRLMRETKELAKEAQGSLSDLLALWATAQYALAVGKVSPEGAGWEKYWKLLRELSHDVVGLRRGDQGSEWLSIERERLADEREERNRKLEELFEKWSQDETVRERICRDFKSRDQMTEELGWAIFGETWDDDKKGADQAKGDEPQKRELTEKLKALFLEWVHSTEVRERLEHGGKTCAELTDEAGRAIFGDTWDKEECGAAGARPQSTVPSPQSKVHSPQSAKGSQEVGPGTGDQGTAHETHETHEMKKTGAGAGKQGAAEAGAPVKPNLT